MKNEHTKDGEKIAIIISILVFVGIIIYVIYEVFLSNKNLYDNSVKEQKPQTEEQQTDNTEKKTEENTDPMNVNGDTLNQISSNVTEKKETEIAAFSSNLYDRDQNRVDNITLAISKLNNAIIKKGEEFSFNNTIGPMDESHGFKEAVGFDTKGNKIKVPGGGMCQISSTLYNVALIANLEITERHPHSRRVYYVPKDKDATVYYGSLDLKFKNNTNHDLKIVATNDNVTVSIKLMKIE